MGGFIMLIKRTRQIKRILIAFFLGCLFLLCSCQKEKGYSITFENNGYGEKIETLTNQTHLPDSLPILSEDGWNFKGWYTDNDTFKDRVMPNQELSKDITLYAKWDKNVTVPVMMLVQYKLNIKEAGKFEGVTTQYVEIGKDATPVTLIPNLGYKFLGWSIDYKEPIQTDQLTRQELNVQKNIYITAILNGPYTCDMIFDSQEGGRVEGTLRQSVLYGDKGEPVVAIPDEGFRFVKWSDGETEAVRTNEKVTYYPASTPHIYAEFERYKRDFKLEYNEATSNTELSETSFYLDDMEKEQYLPVPQREGYEFMGWYSDWFHTVQVTDETGKMIVDRDWFNNDYIFISVTNPDMKLFAKWKPIKEVPIFKILLVYVTEVHATLETHTGEMQQVDYLMSNLERRHCELNTIRMEEYLEAILNGTVDFQIDTYFTKEPLSNENFYQGTTTLGGETIYYDYGIAPEDGQLPEINDLLDDYRSILVSFSLNDRDMNLHITAGHAGAKYGSIHLDTIFFRDYPEYTFDITYPGVYRVWIEQLSLYIHEFTHTVEEQLKPEDNYGIHDAWEYFTENGGVVRTEFDFLVDYLRNEFRVGDRHVGIPYEFWSGEYEKKSLYREVNK
jgi:Listeria/Bacterioides repeat